MEPQIPEYINYNTTLKIGTCKLKIVKFFVMIDTLWKYH